MAIVWIATEMYPEPSEVLLAETEERLLQAVRDSISRFEYGEFVATLQGDEATSVTYDSDPREVIVVWAGDFVPEEDGNGYSIGEKWLVKQQEVLS